MSYDTGKTQMQGIRGSVGQEKRAYAEAYGAQTSSHLKQDLGQNAAQPAPTPTVEALLLGRRENLQTHLREVQERIATIDAFLEGMSPELRKSPSDRLYGIL